MKKKSEMSCCIQSGVRSFLCGNFCPVLQIGRSATSGVWSDTEFRFEKNCLTINWASSYHASTVLIHGNWKKLGGSDPIRAKRLHGSVYTSASRKFEKDAGF